MPLSVQPLLEYLHSVYSVLNLPFPEFNESTRTAMVDIVVMERVDVKNSQDPSQSGSQAASQTARPTALTGPFHNRPLWNELGVILDPSVLEHLLAQNVYAKFPGNKWLQLIGVPNQSQWVKPPTTTATGPQYSVHKVECLYRTNWNKKCPLGVSNIMHAREFITPEKFSQTVLGASTEKIFPDPEIVDALWTLRQNCTDIESSVDMYLGSTCPVPDINDIHLRAPLDVLRNVPLLEYATSPHKVVQAVLKVFRRILPDILWASTPWEKLLHHYLVGLTRFESLDLPSKMVAFIFRKIIVPLISYMFYATDASGGDMCEIFYFRRPLWDIATTKASLGLVKLLGLSTCNDTGLAGAKVRWAPKKSGMRPIIVQPPFLKEKTRKLLLYLNAVRQGKLGCSVLTRADCYKKLLEFVDAEKNYEIYYLSADIQNCFESIPFKPLSEALASLAPENTKFQSVMVSTFRMMGSVPPRKRALVFLDAKNLIEQVSGSPDPDNPTVIVVHKETLADEKMNYQNVQSEIFRILTSSVYRLSTVGSTTTTAKYKVSNRGLPQGLSLSVMLVSIFYAWTDSQWVRPPSSVMVRLVDDILCLCKTEDDANTVKKHIVEQEMYGSVNQGKLEFGKIDPSENACISWAGFQLRPADAKLNVRTCNEKSGKPPRKFRDVDSFFKNFLGRSLAQNALPILFCSKLNSASAVNENAFRIGVMAARKIQLFLRSGLELSETELCKFATKLDRFMKRRFGNRSTLLKQFRFAFEKTLRNS